MKKLGFILSIILLSVGLDAGNNDQAKELSYKAQNTDSMELKKKYRTEILDIAPDSLYGLWIKGWYEDVISLKQKTGNISNHCGFAGMAVMHNRISRDDHIKNEEGDPNIDLSLATPFKIVIYIITGYVCFVIINPKLK